MDTEYIDKMIKFLKKSKEADALLYDIFCGNDIEFSLPPEYCIKLEKYFDEE